MVFFFAVELSCNHAEGSTEVLEIYTKTCQISVNKEMSFNFLCTMDEDRNLVMKGPNNIRLEEFQCPCKLVYKKSNFYTNLNTGKSQYITMFGIIRI